MLKVLDEGSGRLLAVRLKARHLKEDSHALANMIDAKIQTYGVALVFVEIEDVDGVDIGAIWEGFQFDRHHAKQIERCAIVGDEAWERWLSRVLSMFFRNAEIRYFTRDRREEALAWVESGEG